MKTPMLSRRHMIASAVTLPLLPAFAAPARAAAEMMGASTPVHNRFKLGDFEVTTLLSGTRTVENVSEIFGLNADPAEFAAVSEAAFLPADRAQFFFTPTLVNTGAELVLFDAGLSPEGITAALAAAGYTPDQVDVVVLTHMHGDHIGGLMGDAGPTFANARYVTGAAEHNHWMAAGNEGFDTSVRPLNDQMTFLDDGGSVAPGLTAVLAAGHTPGHMGYMIDSGDRQMMLIADLANHPVWSLAHPDWEVRFDMDKEAAAASRRRVLDMLAADRVPMIGYHMPFPAMGHVETRGDGFHYVPMAYQMMLEG
ncbi:MBL fold metallo-hydrolase [Szabonella alba]|uniref:MBL fold metallo-hydrolase n=1 Tax=Szabonella alba TaxID=2804194 RepID=A0A8K0Y0T3_9RHOB|nr:MBL fold metallo-hydrolase [Szabonella alba]MBL4918151.1 MBL fold metallo-hydrolase [Szabonella alba]